MANRILKDSIWDSDTLAALPDFIEDQFPRWLILADDWGCFCADADTIKGKVYPKRPSVTTKKVEEIRLEFYQAGILFCWVEGDRIWGYWTNFGEHNYTTSVDNDGIRQKNRRRTPEPPAELLDAYLKKYGKVEQKKIPRAAPWDDLGQDGTARDKKLKLELELDSQLDSKSKLETGVPIGTLVAGATDTPPEPPAITPKSLFQAYNDNRNGLPEAREFTKERRSKAQARLNSHSRDPDKFLQDFVVAVQRAAATPFCRGDTGGTWKVDFDWLVKNDTNYLKVLEGKYDEGKPKESRAESIARKNKESGQRVRDALHGTTGNGNGSGNTTGTPGLLRGGLIGS